MSVQNLTPGIKPILWNFDPDLIAPEWRWFHGSPYKPRMLVPFFVPTAMGTKGVRDYSGSDDGSGKGTPQNAAFVHRSRGLAYLSGPDKDISRVIVFDSPEFASGTLPITVMWHGVIDGTDDDQVFIARWQDIIFRIDSSQYQFILSEFDTNDRALGGTKATGEQIIIGRFDGTDISIWKDGVKLAEDTPTGSWSTSGSQSLQICSRASGGSQNVVGATYQVGMWEGAWSDAEIRQFVYDPFGPWRPDFRTVGKAPAVAVDYLPPDLAHQPFHQSIMAH